MPTASPSHQRAAVSPSRAPASSPSPHPTSGIVPDTLFVSQEALALQAGLSRTYVSEVECGTRNISIDNMGLLADALGMALCDLLVTDMLKRLAAD